MAGPEITPYRLNKMRREVEQTASLVAPSGGKIKTELSDHWAADLNTKTIHWRPTSPIPPHGTITDEEMLYLISHESGHIAETGEYARPNKLSDGELMSFHRLVNYVEDMRIERKLSKQFPGFSTLRQDILPDVLKSHSKNDMAGYSPLDQAGLAWMSREVGEQPVGGDPGWLKWAADQWDTIDSLADAENTLELSKGLIPLFMQLKDHMMHPTPPPPSGGGDGQGDGDGDAQGQGQGDGDEDGEGAGSGKGDGQGPDKGQQPGGRKAGKGNLDADMSYPYVIREFTPFSQEQVLEGMSEDAISDKARSQLGTEWHKEIQEKQKALGAARQLARSESKSERDLTSGGHDETTIWEQHKDRMRLPTAAFTRRIQAVLKTNAADNWHEGKRRGSLNTHRLHKTGAGNYRVFRKRDQIGKLDYTFGILVDVSGSMQGQASGMLDVMTMMCESFEKCGINHFVLPFNDGLTHGVKLSNQSLKSRRGFLANRIGRPSGGTYEAPALVQAQHEFRKHPTGIKVLICITDGETSGYDESREIINELREKQGIASFGIGIGCAAPRHYDEKIQINRAEALLDELPRIARTIMRKGGGS